MHRRLKPYYESSKPRRPWKHRAKEDPSRIPVRNALHKAIKEGLVVRPDHCVACKKVCIPHAHHESYARPLDVIWLCHACHMWLHAATKRQMKINAINNW